MRLGTRITALMGLCIVGGLSRSFSGASALAQSTQPAATRSSDEPAADAPMRRWFDQLADADPKVREQARVDLMGLSDSDLPKLRQLVIDKQPIKPAQVAALHDIVIQCHLAGETYEARDGGDTTASGEQAPYFLGIDWPNTPDSNTRLGVLIEERFAGFPGFRYLHTGDMILGVYLDPTLSLQQDPNAVTQMQLQLIHAITAKPNIQNIVLLVLRDGEQIRIPVKMAPRPANAPADAAGAMRSWTAVRIDQAEVYWQEHFAPLLEAREAAMAIE